MAPTYTAKGKDDVVEVLPRELLRSYCFFEGSLPNTAAQFHQAVLPIRFGPDGRDRNPERLEKA